MRLRVVALPPRPILPQPGHLFVDPEGWVELQVLREEAVRIAGLGDVVVTLTVEADPPPPRCRGNCDAGEPGARGVSCAGC